MINICSSEKCCGCGACSNSCPSKAITFIYNEYGFLAPSIDQNKCIDCQICANVCQANSKPHLFIPNKCYASIRSDEEKRLDSSSGGIASLLYEKFLSAIPNSVAFGVAYDERLVPVYSLLKSVDDISKTRGSKYVFSNMANAYFEVETAIRKGNRVLFIGMPCQVNGLKKYLSFKKIDFSNIFMCDIFCHGMASEKYFLDELAYYKQKYKLDIIENVTFRSNRKGKNFRFSIYAKKKNGKKIIHSFSFDEDWYFYGFLKEGLTLRESCYSCQYSCAERIGDLSIGDFIGLGGNDQSNKPQGFEKNPSCILVNSEKGELLMKLIANDCKLLERDVDEAVDGGASLQKPYPKSKRREVFLRHYLETQDFMGSVDLASNNYVKKHRLTCSLSRWIREFYFNNVEKSK